MILSGVELRNLGNIGKERISGHLDASLRSASGYVVVVSFKMFADNDFTYSKIKSLWIQDYLII